MIIITNYYIIISNYFNVNYYIIDFINYIINFILNFIINFIIRYFKFPFIILIN